jgi:hypothetical protein
MPTFMKASATLFLAVATLVASGCSTQPSADCLIQYATGFTNYAAAYTGIASVGGGPFDAGGNADCQYFTYPGNPRPTALNPPGYQVQALVAGLPFQASMIGLDKFYPDGGLPGVFEGNFILGITPEIFQGSAFTGTTSSSAFGTFTSNFPDAMNLCYVNTLTPAVWNYDFVAGAPVAPPAGTAITYLWKNFQLYVTNSAQGTQAQATVDITVGTCAAQFTMTAVAPAANCAKIQPDGTAVQVDASGNPVLDGSGNPIPLVAGFNTGPSQVQADICTNFNAITSGASAQQWTNYTATGLNDGASVNQNFPLVCDPITTYCLLDTAKYPFPSLLSAPRP